MTIQTQISLFRHVKVDGPAGLYGHTDVAPELEHNGVAFEWLSRALATQYDLILTSPLQRCKRLAEQLSHFSGLQCIELVSFQEMNFGILDGVAYDSMVHDGVNRDERWRLLEKFWQRPAEHALPQAETLVAFQRRIEQAWSQLLQSHRGKRLLLLTHGGVIRMILANILQLDWKNPLLYKGLSISHGSLTRVNCFHYQDEVGTETEHCQVGFIGLPVGNKMEGY